MIEIDRLSFCGLSTSGAWQQWLFVLDKELYKNFSDEMRVNKGCSQNRQTMEKYFQILMANSKYAHQFIDFIKTNYPFMIKKQTKVDNPELDALFKSNLLTYPRRTIIYSNLHDFLFDKLRYDVYFDTEKYYVEYLEKTDLAIAEHITEDKWFLQKYKARRINDVRQEENITLS